MKSRILNRQRMLAEAGRLRLGYTVPHGDNGKTRPVRSETWIVTSHSEDHIRAAAALWGGDVEQWQPMGSGAQQWRVITEASAIDAILPPGDPLTQAYEQWTKGGCQVRCDGVTEQFTGNPCLCLARFGENWYERTKDVCDSKSRLKVLLPDMPGLGVWRMETGSYYATNEIAGMVDVIRGSVGEGVLVPVRLRIEQRTRVAEGKTKQFVVPVLELRGVTAGELLAGHIDRAAIGAGGNGQQRVAIEAGPAKEERPDYIAQAKAAVTLDQWRAVWNACKEAGHGTPELVAELTEIGKNLLPEGSATPATTPESEAVKDQLWQQILAVAGELQMDLSIVREDFAAVNSGLAVESATAADMETYLADLKRRVTA